MSSFIGWLLGSRECEDSEKNRREVRESYERHSEEHAIRQNLAAIFDLPFDMLCAEEARLEALVRRGNNNAKIRLWQVNYVRQYREVHEPQTYEFGSGRAVAQAPAPAAPQQAAPPVINITINGGGGGYSVSAVEGGGRADSGNARGGTNDSAPQTEAVVAALMRQLGPMLTQAIGNRQAAPSLPAPQRAIAAPSRQALAAPSRQAVALVRKP